MIEVIHQSEQISRKQYSCDACNFLFEFEPYELGLTFTEMREMVEARQKGYKILKGEKYIKQFNTDGGNAWTFRANPEIHKICCKYELYEEI